MKNKPPVGRILPPKFKHVMEVAFHRRLTLKERLQIAVGYNLILQFSARIEYSPGKWEPTASLITSPVLHAEEKPNCLRRLLRWAFGSRYENAVGQIITTLGKWQKWRGK